MKRRMRSSLVNNVLRNKDTEFGNLYMLLNCAHDIFRLKWSQVLLNFQDPLSVENHYRS